MSSNVKGMSGLCDIIRSEWGTGCLPAKIKTPGMETLSACPNLAKTGWVFSVNYKVYRMGFTTLQHN